MDDHQLSTKKQISYNIQTEHSLLTFAESETGSLNSSTLALSLFQ